MSENEEAEIVPFNRAVKSPDLFTMDEKGALALLLQQGQKAGVFEKAIKAQNDEGASFWAAVATYEGEEITLAAIAKQMNPETGNPIYYMCVSGFDEDGDFRIPVHYSFQTLDPMLEMLRNEIQSGFKDEPLRPSADARSIPINEPS